MDEDGRVDWNEFALYLKWAIRQYPQTMTAEHLLSIAFRKGIIPAMPRTWSFRNKRKKESFSKDLGKDERLKKTQERFLV